MLPAAELVHHSATRLRVRIPAQRGQPAYFDRLVSELARLPGLERIEANPVTATVLIVPAPDPAQLARRAAEAGLFALAGAASTPGAPLAQTVARSFAEFNDQLRRTTGGVLDLPSVGLLAFVSAALLQLQRGQVLGPASTLLWSAVGLLRMSHRPPPDS